MAETNTKSVQFKFVLDQQSFAQVKGALQELTQQAQKFSDAMKSAGGGFFGGGTAGAGAAGKSTAQTVAGGQAGAGTGPVGAAAGGVKRAADEGVSALQKLTRELKKNVQEQKRDLSDLTGALSRLGQGFGQLGLPMGGISRVGGMLGMAPGAARAGGGVSSWLEGGTMTAAGVGLGVAGMGATAAVLARQGFLGYRELLRAPQQAYAAYGQACARPLQELAAGDFTRFGAAATMGQAELSRIQSETGAGGSLEYALKHPFNFLFHDKATYESEMNAEKMKRVNDIYEQHKATLGYQRDVGLPQQYFESSFDQRLAARRILGVQTGLKDYADVNRYGKDARFYGDLQFQLRSQGYDMGALMGATTSIRGQVGGEGTGFAGAIMRAGAAGFSGFDQLISASVRSGNKGTSALAAMGGPLASNPQMAIQLGHLALGTGFDPAGTTGGLGMLTAMQGGVGIGMSQGFGAAQLLAQTGAGVQTGQTLFSDSSGLQAGRNLLSAIEAGPGLNTYGQVALSQLSFGQVEDIMRQGVLPPHLVAAGVTKDMVQKYYAAGAKSALLDYAVDDDQPGSLAVKRFRASGQPLPQYLQDNPDQISVLAGAAALSRPELGVEGSQAMFRMLAVPLGAKFAPGKAPARGIDPKSLEGRRLRALAETERAREEKLITGGGEVIGKEYDTAAEAARSGLEKVSGAAGDAADEIQRLSGNIAKLNEKLEHKGTIPRDNQGKAQPIAPGATP